MALSLRPPDFYRLYEGTRPGDGPVLAPPALPASSSGGTEAATSTTYSMFGGVYTEPPIFVAELPLDGPFRQQYDGACLTVEGGSTTVKTELLRLSREVKLVTRRLMLALADHTNPSELSDELSGLFANMSHLLSRCREHEAWASTLAIARAGLTDASVTTAPSVKHQD